MCGFLGFIGSPIAGFEKRWTNSNNIQIHRGPDSQKDIRLKYKDHQLFLGFQRLSIIDISQSADQPMISDDRSSIILFNGEIYNYIELKKDLLSLGCVFKTNSDTEVLLQAINYWGPAKACKKFNGMWSFVYIDKKNGGVFLSKDRLGKKPLYYYLSKEGLYFSSEAKSLLEMVGKKFSLDFQVVGEFVFQSQLNTSNSFFLKNISTVSSRTIKHFSIEEKIIEKDSIKYWNFPTNETPKNNTKEIIQNVKNLFINSVKLRLRSDVPLGILLSGGLDSSSIASVANKYKKNNISFFSATDSDPRFSELPFINKMGDFLESKIHKFNLSLSAVNIFKTLEELIWINDQPLGSLSNLTHYQLVNIARQSGVKVLLTGQGADELLCGYRKYPLFYIKYLIKKGQLRTALKFVNSFYKNKTIFNQWNFSEAKRYLKFIPQNGVVNASGDALNDAVMLNLGLEKNSSILYRQIKDFNSFSIPQLLHTEDRMSMANSSEIRAPFLDYHLIENILPLSVNYKLSQGWTKFIFRKAMEDFLPKEIVWRKDKQNFGNGQGELLKSKLKNEIIDDYFSSDSFIFKNNIINRKKLLSLFYKYSRTKSNKGSISYKEIFAPISLEIWLRKFERYIS